MVSAIAERRLKDGTVLRLKRYGRARYQLNLVDGLFTYQFPTTEKIGESAVRKMYKSVDSADGFFEVLQRYNRPFLRFRLG